MTPTIEYFLLAPVLAVFIGAIIAVLAEAFVPRAARFLAQVGIALLTLATALGFTIYNWWTEVHAPSIGVVGAEGSVALDNSSYAIWSLLLVFAMGAVGLAGERRVNHGVSAFTPMGSATPGSSAEREATASASEHSEIFPLILFSVTGMLIFPAASDFITAFIGLEIMSLPLYLLAGLARRSRLLSQEAALKYFLLGALSSAIFLFGVVMLYGFSGTTGMVGSFDYAAISDSIPVDAAVNQSAKYGIVLLGLGLVGIGLLFKVGVVPFHSWVPDVYTGSPTPISAFMAVCTKIAAVGALIRILYAPLGALVGDWQLPLAVLAALTMAVGAIFGLTQSNVKRLLAYSSISHAGFLLTGVVAAAAVTSIGEVHGNILSGITSVSATWYYLAAYGFATLGAFAVVQCVRGRTGENPDLVAWAGFGRRNPVLGIAMTLFLLSMAGIPLTGGFIGKVFSFTLAWQNGYAWLVIVGLVFSLMTAAFYLRLVWTMFFANPSEELEVAAPSPGLYIVLGVCALGTLATGLVPGLFTDILGNGAVLVS